MFVSLLDWVELAVFRSLGAGLRGGDGLILSVSFRCAGGVPGLSVCYFTL